MKITYNWLKEFINIDLTPEEIGEKLTLAGIEVSSIEKHNEFLKDVIVAKIVDIEKVKDSDKLSLCKVYNGEEILDIICGAKNMKKGDYVALAKIGAVLPGDFKIKKSKIRGVYSYGMLCSEKELSLANESSGIMILPDNLTLGKSIGEELNLFDTIIEFEITPNRGDCLSVFGIARELAGITGSKIKLPNFELKEIEENISNYISVEILAPELCPRYTARIVKDVKIKESPLWMKNRLVAVGLRPINNIVDITNYLMIELGQPMHAFDYNFIKGKKIIVKTAEKGERFITLDGKEHQLDDTILMICDAERSVAIGGIMGGLNSEVQESTNDILLEAAYFNPENIRVSSKKLNLSTDASYRFERGIDIENVEFCSKRAAYLMQEIGEGKVIKGVVDAYPLKYSPKNIKLRENRLNLIAGCKINYLEAKKILKNLGFIEKENNYFLVPSWRHDISIEEDLIEEVLRIYGYEKIPEKLPSTIIVPEYKYSFLKFCNDVKRFMVNVGLSETINYSFTNSKLLKEITPNIEPIFLLNPLTEELEALRTNLLTGLLKNISDNIKYKNLNLKLFELGKIFIPDKSLKTGVKEIIEISSVFTGFITDPIWNLPTRKVDFFDLKGILEAFFKFYRIKEIKYEYPNDNEFQFLIKNKSAILKLENKIIGFIGAIHPDILEKFEIEDTEVLCFNLKLENIYPNINILPKFNEISKFPKVERDLALLVDEEINSEEILKLIKDIDKKLIQKIYIFDVYKGKNIPEGKKSIAIKIIFQDKTKTLKDEKVNKIIDKILKKLNEELNITIRNQ